MGRKEDQQWASYMAMLQNAINQSNQPNQYETQLGDEANKIGTFLNSRDYRNLPTGVNVDLLPLAEYQKMRKMQRGENNGTAAQGVINPQILKQQQEYDDNNFLQSWGNAYENKVGGLMDRKDQLLGGLSDAGRARSQNNVANYSNLLQAFANKPKSNSGSFWGSLLGGGLSAAAKFI